MIAKRRAGRTFRRSEVRMSMPGNLMVRFNVWADLNSAVLGFLSLFFELAPFPSRSHKAEDILSPEAEKTELTINTNRI